MPQDNTDLSLKTAYVIGGAGLIGTEVSKALANAGATTVVLDIDKRQFLSLRRGNKKVHFEHFDAGDLDAIEQQFEEIKSTYGSPEIFINCSYPRTIDWGNGSFSKITLKSLRENIDMHLNSYAWLARMAAEEMVTSAQGGSIIQFGSIYGVVGQDLTVYKGTDMHENMAYSMIKGGIINLTRQMASYYGKFNIRVNTLCPGGLVGHVAGKSDGQHPEFVKQYSEKVPLKRLGRAEEIASVALFLASEASSYVSGATIMVDGGWTAI